MSAQTQLSHLHHELEFQADIFCFQLSFRIPRIPQGAERQFSHTVACILYSWPQNLHLELLYRKNFWDFLCQLIIYRCSMELG